LPVDTKGVGNVTTTSSKDPSSGIKKQRGWTRENNITGGGITTELAEGRMHEELGKIGSRERGEEKPGSTPLYRVPVKPRRKKGKKAKATRTHTDSKKG